MSISLLRFLLSSIHRQHSLALAVVFIAASVAPLSAVRSEAVQLGKQEVKAGDPFTTVEVPFNLEAVPSQALLRFDLRLSTAGTCPRTYTPTVIRLNGRTVESIDFRRWTVGSLTEMSLKVPGGVLRPGANVLQIRTGYCQYQYDRIKLNNIVLADG